MHWWDWLLIWFGGFAATFFLLGWVKGVSDNDNEWPGYFFASAVWPLFLIIALPYLGGEAKQVLTRRRNAREERRIRIEAEKQVIREERLRSAPMRKICRKLDL